MKSKSPFAMKSPLLAYKSDMRGNYANPRYVKEELVGVKIGEAMTKAGTDIFSGLTAPDETDSSGTIATHGLGGGEYKGFGGGMREINLPEIPDVNTNLTDKGFGRFTKSESEVPDLVRQGKAERNIKTVSGKKVLTHEANADKLGYKKGTQERTDFINASTEYNKLKYKTDEPTKEGKANNYITMKGSPNKLIGDTMDPYGQPQRGIRDFTFNENEIALGTLGNQASMGVQKEIYGGGQAQVAAEQLASQAAISPRADEMDLIGNPDSSLAMKGTPLHTEGHGGAKDHTHAKPGDYLDQTVAEDMGVNDIEDYKPIQKFKGKQMVVNSKKKDTIFSTNSTFVIPKQMQGITQSPEGTPKYKPVYINRNKKQ